MPRPKWTDVRGIRMKLYHTNLQYTHHYANDDNIY